MRGSVRRKVSITTSLRGQEKMCAYLVSGKIPKRGVCVGATGVYLYLHYATQSTCDSLPKI